MVGARALLAFQRGEDTYDADLGALMHAEFQAMVVKFVEGMSKASKK